MENIARKKILYLILFFLIIGLIVAVFLFKGTGLNQDATEREGKVIEEGIKIGDCVICTDFYESLEESDYGPSIRAVTEIEGTVVEINDEEFSIKVEEVGQGNYIKKLGIWVPNLFVSPKPPKAIKGEVFVCKPEIGEKDDVTGKTRWRIDIKKISCQ